MMVEALKDWPLVQSPAEEKYLLVKRKKNEIEESQR